MCDKSIMFHSLEVDNNVNFTPAETTLNLIMHENRFEEGYLNMNFSHAFVVSERLLFVVLGEVHNDQNILKKHHRGLLIIA